MANSEKETAILTTEAFARGRARGGHDERERIVDALLAEACELTLTAEKAGEYRKYEDAGRFIQQARILRDVVLTIRNMPKAW